MKRKKFPKIKLSIVHRSHDLKLVHITVPTQEKIEEVERLVIEVRNAGNYTTQIKHVHHGLAYFGAMEGNDDLRELIVWCKGWVVGRCFIYINKEPGDLMWVDLRGVRQVFETLKSEEDRKYDIGSGLAQLQHESYAEYSLRMEAGQKAFSNIE